MIVPQYWAEARLQQRVKNRQVTVRRFGWSDASQQDAQADADARAEEALRRILAGETLLRREPKRAYNGAAGVPIREEILARHGETVITRNAYGAHCLNTPNVLFVDVDFLDAPGGWLWLWVAAALVFGAAAAGWALHSWRLGLVVGLFSLLLSGLIAAALHRLYLRLAGGPERLARRRIAAFSRKHPDWHLRVYRTPAGFRLLAMQRTFDPLEPAVARCFKALGADPLYARMCRNQHCFRARVSPKPWRIGIGSHLKPRPGIWPVDPSKMPERTRWIETYESAAAAYAACRFVEALGSGDTDPAARAVQILHDDLCRAASPAPIA